MIKNISYFYLHYILKNPLYAIMFLLIILAGMMTFASNFKLDASADSLILENDKDLVKYRNTISKYDTKEFIVMTYTPNDGKIFDDNNLLLIKKLKNQLTKIDGIESVLSIIDVPLVESSELPLAEMIDNVPTLLSEGTDIIKAEKEILTSPIYKNLIISDDGRTTALQINIKPNAELIALTVTKSKLNEKLFSQTITYEENLLLNNVKNKYKQLKLIHNENIHNLLADVRSIQNSFQESSGVELRIGGIPMIADDMISYVKNDLINFGLGVFIFIIFTLIIIFRKLKWVILPILSCIYAVSIMIGLLGMIDWEVTVISSNFISLMLILTLSMNIHLIVRYRQLSSLMSNQYLIVCETTKQMVWPCLYTALTTIVAFASLVFSDIKPVIDFGYMMTFGLVVTFITSFILLPSILCLLSKDEHFTENKTDSFLFTKLLADLTLSKGKAITIITSLALIATIYGISQLKVENSFINYFKSNTEIYKGMKQIDDKSPISNINVRKAMNYAIDRETIAKTILSDVSSPVSQMATPEVFGYNPKLDPYPFDPLRAKKLLADAGFESGIKLRAIVRSDPSVPESTLVNQVVAQNLSDVGIDVVLQAVPGTRWISMYFSGDWDGADLLETSFNNTIHGDVIRSIETASCIKTGAFFCDKDMMVKIYESNQEFNNDLREKKLQKIIAQLHFNPPALYLFPYFDTLAFSPRLKNLPMTGQKVNMEMIEINQ